MSDHVSEVSLYTAFMYCEALFTLKDVEVPSSSPLAVALTLLSVEVDMAIEKPKVTLALLPVMPGSSSWYVLEGLL